MSFERVYHFTAIVFIPGTRGRLVSGFWPLVSGMGTRRLSLWFSFGALGPYGTTRFGASSFLGSVVPRVVEAPLSSVGSPALSGGLVVASTAVFTRVASGLPLVLSTGSPAGGSRLS